MIKYLIISAMNNNSECKIKKQFEYIIEEAKTWAIKNIDEFILWDKFYIVEIKYEAQILTETKYSIKEITPNE